jgi:hypothetical protein
MNIPLLFQIDSWEEFGACFCLLMVGLFLEGVGGKETGTNESISGGTVLN